ncbi:methionine--tRNA ligase [Mesomycoplasma neurolyticum]|uniref:Methionine--tRNA ligase n=1 Tax=Mesomycoplasma neurolyticum TaxID=2120 RepID=A0A449A4I8_9BACT|nr:methionine--tRNA ligase [Mesomycoplasma neurolyticum]VEU59171.1 Methionine--tRNA ligase [Mesomycoplasma neurolyticum]
MQKNKKTFFITSPIFYTSGNLHIGHLYTNTLAWVLKNYKILRGYEAKFLTGSDEHGQKILKKANELNMDVKEYVDAQVEKFVELWKLAEIDYDFFSRTTNKNHMEIVQNIFEKLLSKKIIYKSVYKGLYSVSSEEFLTPNQAVEENGKFYHPVSKDLLIELEEESYFFKMSSFQKWLINHWKTKQNIIFPTQVITELLNNFVKKNLEDLSVTRVSFDWGIKIKSDKKHVIYVWLDALFNYITALNYSLENDNDYVKFWKNGDEKVHIIGKEISRFHCIYWPIFLNALDLPQPTKIIVHGLINDSEGRKMSKSLNNVVDPIYLLKKYSPEVVKFYLSTQLTMTSDSKFDEEHLKSIYNSLLSNNYGNLLSRTIAMVKQSFIDKPVKYKENQLTKLEKEIFDDILKTKEIYINEMDNFLISKAYKSVFDFSKKLNGYIDITMPWTLKNNLERLEVVLNTLLNGIYSVSVFLSIIFTKKINEVKNQLKIDDFSLENIGNWNLFDNIIVEKKEPLFQRISEK